MSLGIKIRTKKVSELVGRKEVNGRVYTYTYYSLPLNIYIPKHVVKTYGRDYVVIVNKETGEIRALPKALYEKEKESS